MEEALRTLRLDIEGLGGLEKGKPTCFSILRVCAEFGGVVGVGVH